MIEPTERTLWLLVVAAVVGVLGLGIPAIGNAAIFIVAGVALGVAVDFALAGSPRRIDVRRALPELAVEGRETELGLEIAAKRNCALEIVDTMPARALPEHVEVDRKHTLALKSGESVRVTTPVTFVRRGQQKLGRVAVRTLGPLGLVRRRARHRVEQDLSVVPDVARIGARAERLLRGQDQEAGSRRRVPREGREFDSLREYQRGDDVRLVEWKQSARRGQLIVKKMRPETRQDVIIAVDAGRQLSGTHAPEDGGEPRLDVAITAALTLAAAGLSRGDRVGLMCFASDVMSWAPPVDGKGHLRRLADSANDTDAVPEDADYGEAARFVIARQKRRALVCFVTDVLDEPSARALASSVAQLRGRHLPVVVALGDPALHRLSRDESLKEAASRLLEHRRRALLALEAAGAVVVDAPAPKAAALAVATYATLKAQGRL